MALKKMGAGSRAPEEVRVVVEIPKGSRNKYEMGEDGEARKLIRESMGK